jgi:hypothetical protein
VGLVTADVDVPSFESGPTLSGVILTSVSSAVMVTRGQARLAARLGTAPTVERVFVAGDRLVAAVEAYTAPPAPAAVTAVVERLGGSVVLELQARPTPADGRPGASEVALPIETSSLSPGRYLLRIRLEGAPLGQDAERRVPFEVVAGPPK